MKKITVTPRDDLQKIFDGITEPTEIYLKNGVYAQKLELDRDDVILRGESREKTVLRFGDYAKKTHADGRPYQTFRTYTLRVTGERVKLFNLTIENNGPKDGGQRVALAVQSERFYANGINLVSAQDTLFLAPFPKDPIIKDWDLVPPELLNKDGYDAHIFENCRISGTVDFIFGCAEAYFKDCEIISLENPSGGYIAAPAHSRERDTGFYFIDCRLIDGGAKSGIYLARPWRDYGIASFINCTAGSHLDTRLVNKWNDTERDKTARFSYYNLAGYQGKPEPWLKVLTKSEADEIIARYERKKSEENK